MQESTRKRKLALTLVVLSLLLLPLYQAVAQLPVNFRNELVTDALSQPIGMTFLPDSRVLVLQKPGQILVSDPNSPPPIAMSQFMTITNIDTTGEHGLINITLDPNFVTNSYFYLYYTHGSSRRNRISRFTSTGDPATRLASEVVIWEDNEPYVNCCHTGGALDFASDGTLYLATGEDFRSEQSQDLTKTRGKVIRINRDGSIPNDNPYKGNTQGYRQDIYSYGLRNPFRGRFDRPTNRFIVGDVGGNEPTSWEDVRVAAPGANFGWADCGDAGRDAAGKCLNPAFTDPVFSYPHQGNGASIVGGVIYRGNQFPASYQGAYFYGDYVRGWIRYLTFDAGLNYSSDNAFDGAAGTLLAIEQGPDNALYYLRLSAYSGTTAIGAGELRRYVYDSQNSAPIIVEARAMGPTQNDTAPFTVNFVGSATDPEGQPLNYKWLIEDKINGQIEVIELDGANVTHTYTSKGQYKAQLWVSDGILTTLSDPIIIQVGTPPRPVITSPSPGHLFMPGDVIGYYGTATDADGVLENQSYAWNVVFNHGTHTHPVSDSIGVKQGSFSTASGHGFSADTGYTITLKVTDADGLTATTSVFIKPDIARMHCNTSLQSDGVDDWVNIPDLSVANDFTVEAWVYLEGTGTNADAIFGQEGSGQDLNFYDNRLRLYAPTATTWDVIVANTANAPNTWTHYAVTRRGNNLSLYINGVLDSTTTTTWTGDFTPKAIGRGTAGFLGGMLDEVRLWNVARTAQEIAGNRQRIIPSNSPGLLGYWKFNEAVDEQIVLDASTHSYNGSLGATTAAGSDDPTRSKPSTLSLMRDCESNVAQTPFNGTPVQLPNTIQAENFDNGGEGTAYHDIDLGNNGGQYRQTDVDIFGAPQVGWVFAGEWLAYSVDVAQAGAYTLEVRYGTPGNGATLHVEADGADITGPITLQNTGDYSIFQTIAKANIQLPAGQHVLKVVFDSNSTSGAVGDFDYFRFTAVSTQTPYFGTPLVVPGTIQAEDFDHGGQNVAYYDTDAGNNGGAYRAGDVDITGIPAVGWAYAGEWLEYTVDVGATGTYTLEATVGAVGSGGGFHIEFSGVNKTGLINVPNTGGWSTFHVVSKTGVQLTAGRHVMRVVMDANGSGTAVGDFNQFRFVRVN